MRNEIFVYILGCILSIFIYYQLRKEPKKHQKSLDMIMIIIYILFLYLCLFDRDVYKDRVYSDGTYIKKWIKILFKNKVVFRNIIGNIIIFIPMGMLIKQIKGKQIYHFLLAISIIICIETLQYITQIGVFDIMDILFNMIGTAIGYIIMKKR